MDELAREAVGCTGCRLATLVRTQVVWGGGPVPAELMLVGQNPGETEDREGEPFVGDAGSYLDASLARAGLSRSSVYITNVAKCWTPENRAPHPDELAACSRLWLGRQVELVRPKLLVGVGGVAVRALTGKAVSVARGVLHAWNGVPVWSTFHPSGLNAALRPHIAADLRRARELLVTLPPYAGPS